MIFRLKLRWKDTLAVTLFGVLFTLFVGGWSTLLDSTIPLGQQFLYGAIGGIGVLCINAVIHEFCRRIFRGSYRRKFHDHARTILGNMGWPEFLAAGLMAGLFEEPLFRGFLLEFFDLRPALGVLLVGVIFGVCHWLRFEFWPFWLWAVWEGVLFGVLMVISGTILVPMVAHAIHDIVAYRVLKTMVRRAAAA